MTSYNNKLELIIICRICLEKSSKQENVIKKEIFKMMEECTSVNMLNINLFPFWICSECTLFLKEFYKFRGKILNKTKQNEESFDVFIEKLKVKIVEETENTINLNSNCLKSEILTEVKLETNEDILSDTDEKPRDLSPFKDNDHNKISEINSNPTNSQLYQCHTCGKVLACANSLYRHKKLHNVSRNFVGKCDICGKGFYETGNLNRHLLRHKGEKKFDCSECPKQFYELSALLKHAKRHKNLQPSFKCTNCDEKFIFQAQLDVHMKTHNINKCKFCDKKFIHRYLAKRHEQTHSKEQPFKCSLCEKSFKHATTLEIHTKKHYGIEKKEICNVCGLSFANVRMHMMTHTTERPHKCLECGKGFRTTVHVREHMRKHTGERRVPKVLCIVCGKKLLDTAKLRLHMRSHTGERPYSCMICDRKFVSGSLLTVHMRSHTGDKPYVCEICGKAFKESGTLKSHVRIHTGERPYTCSVCNKAFTQSGALKTHMKVHPV